MNSIEITKVSPFTSAPIFEMRVAARSLLMIRHRSETVSDMFFVLFCSARRSCDND
jgi:hypothetical protein